MFKGNIGFVPEGYAQYSANSIIIPIQRLLNKANELSEFNDDISLSDIDSEIILDLLNETELVDKSLRSCLSDDYHIDLNKAGYGDGDEKIPWTDISIHEYPGAILLIELPQMVSMSYKTGRCSVSLRTEIELAKWFSDHDTPLFDKKNKFVFVYKRFIPKDKKVFNVCDNDNWEMRRVTNAVISAMGYSDNSEVVDFFYTTVQGYYNGAELLVIRQKDLRWAYKYLSTSTPIHPESPAFNLSESAIKELKDIDLIVKKNDIGFPNRHKNTPLKIVNNSATVAFSRSKKDVLPKSTSPDCQEDDDELPF